MLHENITSVIGSITSVIGFSFFEKVAENGNFKLRMKSKDCKCLQTNNI